MTTYADIKAMVIFRQKIELQCCRKQVIQAVERLMRPVVLQSLILASGIALISCIPSLSKADQATSMSYPVLKPFYRGTQLQGHLFGMGLITIPSYLTDKTIAFPYKNRPGFMKEIPFTDSFTINRVLGGYPLAWLQRFHLVNPMLGEQSLDYVVRGPDDNLHYQPALVKARLAPYLTAGYKPADITLSLDNVPWALATPNNAPPLEGPWGRKSIAGDRKQWTDIVDHFAVDLKSLLGNSASDFTFETGIEYNSRESFDGDQDDFFKYYVDSYNAIHKVLPRAQFHPGEFTGTGVCTGTKKCSYDVKTFLTDAMRLHIAPQIVPRSLYQLATSGRPWPYLMIDTLKKSYTRLDATGTRIVPEVHQFGLLFQPFGKSSGRDPGAMQASWEFESLILMVENGAPRNVYHWATFENVGGHDILNGSGFDMLVLDHYIGDNVIPLAWDQQPRSANSEVLAVAFEGKDSKAVAVANFTPRPQSGDVSVLVKLPVDWPSKRLVRIVDFASGRDIFSVIRNDLLAEGKLKQDFVRCMLCEGSPTEMAVTPSDANLLVDSRWKRYERLLSDQLHWRKPDQEVTVSGETITISLASNEVLVIEPN